MMLDGDELPPAGVIAGPARAEVAGMQVVGDDFRFGVEQSLIPLDRLFEGGERFRILHITDVRAEECIPAARQAEGVLQFAADRQDRRNVEGQ